MNKIVDKKFNALLNIISTYENTHNIDVEKQINDFCSKFSEKNFEIILDFFLCYKTYLLSVLASTRRVFVKLTKDEQKLDDLEFLFGDID